MVTLLGWVLVVSQALLPVVLAVVGGALVASAVAIWRLVTAWREGRKLLARVRCLECGATVCEVYPVERATMQAYADSRHWATEHHQKQTGHQRWVSEYLAW